MPRPRRGARWAAVALLAVAGAAILAGRRRGIDKADSGGPTPAPVSAATLAPTPSIPDEARTPEPRPPAPSAPPRTPRESVRSAPVAPAETPAPTPLPSPSATPLATPEPGPSPTPPPAATPAPEGALLVLVTPWADVSVDGEPRGQTPLARIPLAPGPHDVRLSHPDYAPFPRRVLIRSGETFRLVVDLPTEGVRRPR